MGRGVNALSDAADRLFDAMERAVAIYTAASSKPLRPSRTPQLAPVVPAVWLGLPTVTFSNPVFQSAWEITIAVDGDQPVQVDALYEIVSLIWDELGREKGFNPEVISPTTIPIQGSEGSQSVLGAVITVGYSVGARTLCPPEMADVTA